MQHLKLLLILSIGFYLTACSQEIQRTEDYFTHRTNAYLQAKNGPGLRVPRGLSSQHLQTQHVIPHTSETPILNSGLVVPPTLQAKTANIQSRINEQNSEHTQLVLPINKQEAWPRVAVALKKAGLTTLEMQKKLGTMYVLDTIHTGGEIEKNTPIYQVHLTGKQQSTVVNITDNQGHTIKNKDAKRILQELKIGLNGNHADEYFGFVF